MTYIILVFVIAVAIIVARVYFNMRRVRQANSNESWDEKAIMGLRARGYAPFNPYPVDFFWRCQMRPRCKACVRAWSRKDTVWT